MTCFNQYFFSRRARGVSLTLGVVRTLRRLRKKKRTFKFISLTIDVKELKRKKKIAQNSETHATVRHSKNFRILTTAFVVHLEKIRNHLH